MVRDKFSTLINSCLAPCIDLKSQEPLYLVLSVMGPFGDYNIITRQSVFSNKLPAFYSHQRVI